MNEVAIFEGPKYTKPTRISDEERRYRTNRHDGGGDGNGGYQLNGNDGINLADEGPSEVRRLQHHWETGAYSRLHVRLPVGVIPYHIFSGNRRRVVLYALFSSSGCTRK
ncbi:unnamed protein product [Citrullus colocynthis]|uniref:Uncharacterized protein n=1 Tax=Citrullus colocynthis TaxID=252529 RepID=A0ABP0XP71_9ROSI